MLEGNKLMAGLVALRALPDSDAIFSFCESLLASLDGVKTVAIEKGPSTSDHPGILDQSTYDRTISIPVVYRTRSFATIQLTLSDDNPLALLSAISNFANLVALELSHGEKNAELTRLLEERSQENSRLIATTLFAAKASGIGVWEFDLDTQNLVWNEQMFEIFGLKPEEAKGSFEDWAERLHPDDAEAAKTKLQECIDSNESFESRFRIVRPSGEVRYISALAEFYADEFSGKRFLIGTNIDVTKTRDLELQLQHAQRLEAVGKLTGGIAHDFNNLLQIISGSVQLVQNRSGDPGVDNSRNDYYLKTAMSAIDSASSLTSRLLAFSRRDQLNPVNTSLASMLDDAVAIIERTLGEDISLEINISPELPPLFIDKHQLENALLNLAINARDAMPKGGLLSISATRPAIEHLVIAGKKIDGRDYVAIAVKDNGDGMTPEVLELVFDPFFTTKEVGQGSGLGLSMVHGFVNQSGGHITIHSKPGVGTLVQLYLPVASGAADVQSDLQPGVAQSGSCQVLLVEDDPAVLDVVQAMLEKSAHEVTAVPTATEALKLLTTAHSRFDLLLTDMALSGGMNGLELAEEVTTNWPEIKIVFSSGYMDRFADQAKGVVTDRNFLRKPYKQKELLDMISLVMSNGKGAVGQRNGEEGSGR